MHLRVKTKIEFAEDSEFLDLIALQELVETVEVTDFGLQSVNAAVSPGLTVDLGFYPSIPKMLLINQDSAIDITATFDDIDGNTISQLIKPGRVAVFNDVDPAADLVLVSDSGAPTAQLFVFST